MSNNSHAEILIVDDDSTSRKILAHLLVAAGYKCRECEDGTRALQTIQERQPALLLLDFDMLGLNGAEVLKRLRSDNDPAVAQIPMIRLTAQGREESEVRFLKAGAEDLVTNPINSAA